MSIPLPPTVKRGDLITADAWNALIQQLQDLDTRLSRLEVVTPGGQGQFAITSLSATTLNVGDPFTINGVNFGQPAAVRVEMRINNLTTVVPSGTYDPGSNENHLKFPMPMLNGLNMGGLVNMLVTTQQNGSDSRDINVFPAPVIVNTGHVEILTTDFRNITTASNTVDAGSKYLLTFNVKAVTTRQDNYDVLFTATSGSVQYVDDNRNPISGPLPLSPSNLSSPGTNIKAILTVSSVAPLHTPGSVTLKLRSQNNPTGITQAPDPFPQPFSVGDTIPQLGSISLIRTGAITPPTDSFDAQGVLQVHTGDQCFIKLNVSMPVTAPAGTYTLSLNNFDEQQITGWKGQALSGASTVDFNYTVTSPPNQPLVTAGVTAPAGALPTTVTWRVKVAPKGLTTPFGELPITVHVT
jgi:hypothetical protein